MATATDREATCTWDVELDPTVLSALPSGPLSVALPEQVAALVRNCVG